MGEFEKDVSALCLLAAPSSLPHLERPGRTFRGKTTQRNRDTSAAITPHLSITASVASTDVSPSLSCSRSPPPSDAMEREDYGTARGGGVLRRRQGARGRRQRIAGRPTEPAVEGRSEAGIRGVNNTADVPEAEGGRRGQGLGRLTYYHKSICRRHHTIDTAAYPFIASSILIVIRMTTNNIAYKSFWVISACVYLKKNRNSFHLIFSKHYFLS